MLCLSSVALIQHSFMFKTPSQFDSPASAPARRHIAVHNWCHTSAGFQTTRLPLIAQNPTSWFLLFHPCTLIAQGRRDPQTPASVVNGCACAVVRWLLHFAISLLVVAGWLCDKRSDLVIDGLSHNSRVCHSFWQVAKSTPAGILRSNGAVGGPTTASISRRDVN